MSWKLGMLWGILLTIIEWLGFLAARGGLPQASVGIALALLQLAVYGYVGFSAFRISGSSVQAMLTAMLAGILTGIFGSLTLFLTPHQSALASVVPILDSGFATALFGVALGGVGVTVARLQQRLRHAKSK